MLISSSLPSGARTPLPVRVEVTKSRMAPEYSIEALRGSVTQHYLNATTFEEAAEAERKKARAMEEMIDKLTEERDGHH